MAVRADKISIAERANSVGAISFATRPKIASGKSTKNCGATRQSAFSLERLENFLDGVAHKTRSVAANLDGV
jgi:hypothetical protein